MRSTESTRRDLACVSKVKAKRVFCLLGMLYHLVSGKFTDVSKELLSPSSALMDIFMLICGSLDLLTVLFFHEDGRRTLLHNFSKLPGYQYIQQFNFTVTTKANVTHKYMSAWPDSDVYPSIFQIFIKEEF